MTNCVGGLTADVPFAGSTEPISVLLFYPAAGDERIQAFGHYEVAAAWNAAPVPGSRALVVISHGTGSSGLTHRNLAKNLAQSGFIVAALDHPGNNRRNNELADSLGILADRPKHVSRVIDWVASESILSRHVETDRVGVVGHSFGGYTALALAGGKPASLTCELPRRAAASIETAPDPRVSALVLLAPATVWFHEPGSLSAVRAPILMLTAGHDQFTTPLHAAIVQRDIQPPQLDHQLIQDAGHFSFQSPFPPTMVKPSFLASQDPPGFDRERFGVTMNEMVRAFLKRALASAREPERPGFGRRSSSP